MYSRVLLCYIGPGLGSVYIVNLVTNELLHLFSKSQPQLSSTHESVLGISEKKATYHQYIHIRAAEPHGHAREGYRWIMRTLISCIYAIEG